MDSMIFRHLRDKLNTYALENTNLTFDALNSENIKISVNLLFILTLQKPRNVTKRPSKNLRENVPIRVSITPRKLCPQNTKFSSVCFASKMHKSIQQKPIRNSVILTDNFNKDLLTQKLKGKKATILYKNVRKVIQRNIKIRQNLITHEIILNIQKY